MNFRLPNLHAAFLLGTIDHADQIYDRISTVYNRLSITANNCGFYVRQPTGHDLPSRFVMQVPSEEYRDLLIERLQNHGIAAGRELMWLCPPEATRQYPIADNIVRTTLSLPFHPCLTDRDLDLIHKVLTG